MKIDSSVMMTVTWQVGLLSKKTLLAGELTKDQAEPGEQ